MSPLTILLSVATLFFGGYFVADVWDVFSKKK